MKHLSYSQINQYMRCGEQYRRRYIEGEIIPPGIALVKGKSVHRGIEANGKQKIDSREDMKKADIIELSVTDYEQTTDTQEIFVNPGENKKDVIGTGKDGVVSLAGLYADEVSPQIQPVAVEEKIVVDMPNGNPIVTILDCIDEAGVIHDFKTAGKSKPQSEIDTSLQFTLYTLAYQDQYGKMPSGLYMDVLVETKTPKYQRLTTTRKPNDWITTMRIIAEVQKAIDAGVFLPAPAGSWICSPKFCGFYNSCKFVQNSI